MNPTKNQGSTFPASLAATVFLYSFYNNFKFTVEFYN